VAKAEGVSNGIARSFRQDLQAFKVVYREDERAANALAYLYRNEGGFVRKD
jgi:hypothetical protein